MSGFMSDNIDLKNTKLWCKINFFITSNCTKLNIKKHLIFGAVISYTSVVRKHISFGKQHGKLLANDEIYRPDVMNGRKDNQ